MASEKNLFRCNSKVSFIVTDITIRTDQSFLPAPSAGLICNAHRLYKSTRGSKSLRPALMSVGMSNTDVHTEHAFEKNACLEKGLIIRSNSAASDKIS